MKKNKQIPAFTLLEMMIALLISGVVIVMAYGILLLFNRQFTQYRTTANDRTEFMLLKRALQLDIDEAVAIKALPDEETFTTKTGNGTLVQYDAKAGRLLRIRDGQVDTFFCRVSIVAVEHINDRLDLVKNISFNVFVNKETMPLYFEKQYTADQLMEEEKYLNE